MTAKDFLKQYEYAQQRADMCRKEYEIEMLKIDAIGSTLAGDGQPHGTGVSRKTEDKAIRLADKAMKWKEAELDAIEVRQTVYDMIWDIEGIEGAALYEKYISLLTWEQVAETLHYSESGIHDVRRRALRIVDDRLNNQRES